MLHELRAELLKLRGDGVALLLVFTGPALLLQLWLWLLTAPPERSGQEWWLALSLTPLLLPYLLLRDMFLNAEWMRTTPSPLWREVLAKVILVLVLALLWGALGAALLGQRPGASEVLAVLGTAMSSALLLGYLALLLRSYFSLSAVVLGWLIASESLLPPLLGRLPEGLGAALHAALPGLGLTDWGGEYAWVRWVVHALVLLAMAWQVRRLSPRW